MSASATNDQTLEAYDKGVDLYVARLNPDIAEELKSWFAQMLSGLLDTASILEIGSGTGRDADYLESLGYNVERTDGSRGFVDYQKALGKDARTLNVLTDEIDGFYDLIFANAVFLHFTEDECKFALRKIYDSLMSGGRLGLSLKRGSGEETTENKMNAPRYFHYWEPEAITDLLNKAGFADVNIAIHDDWRKDKPQWLFITATKGDA